MDNDIHNKIYEEYISALKELVDAQEKAKEFSPAIPLYPEGEPPDLTSSGKDIFHRLMKAYEVYAEKYKIWRISKKVNAL